MFHASVRLLLALFAILAVAAIPAAAAPRAVEFERSLGGAATARAASATIETGRFDLVGLRWRSAPDHPHLRLRVRARGEWKRWVDVPASHSTRGSDPVLAKGADALQLRGTRGIRGLRLKLVRVSGRAEPRARAAKARAQGAPPPIVMRDQWGGQDCKPRDGPTFGQVQMAFVHHTVSANDYAPEDSAGMVLAVCKFHRNSNGWDDLGYNFLVDKYGQIFEGRAGGIDQAVVGAQAQGWNDDSTGIANLGTYQDVPQTDQALDAMARLIAWKLPLHGAPVTGTVTLTSGGGSSNRHPAGRAVTYERISGHRDGNSTACPGEQLFQQLPRLRQMAAGQAPAPAPPPPGPVGGVPAALTIGAQRTALAFPEPVRLGGRLTDAAGAGLPNVRVRVQVLTGLGFKAIGDVVTDPAGNYVSEFPATRNRTVRALVGSVASPPVKITVAPAITAAVASSRVLIGQRAVLRGQIRPKKPAVIVVISKQVGTTFTRVGALRFKAAGDGRFRAPVLLRRPGLYRLRTTFAGDTRNSPARGPDAFVRAVRKLSAASGGQAAR